MLEYRLPYNRDFSAAQNFNAKLIEPNEEVGYVDSPFAVVAPAGAITGHPHISDAETFDVSPYSLLFEQPPAGGVQEYVEWARPVEFINDELWGQLYTRLSALPPADWTLFRFIGFDDTIGPRLVGHSDGTFQWYIGATAVSSRTTFAVEPDERYRIEWHIEFETTGQAYLEANFYERYQLDDITSTSKNIGRVEASGVSTILDSGNRFQVGWVAGSQPAGVRLYVGGLSMNEDGFVGPCLWYYDPDQLADEVYEQLEPIVAVFGDPGGHLRTYTRAAGRIHQPLLDMMKDGPNGEPGWSQLLDSRRLKPQWLPWSAQMVGYRAPAYRPTDDVSAYLMRQTRRMQKFSSHKRGGTDMLREVVRDNLWGRRRVIILERAGDEANQIRVYVYQDDIMDGMTIADLERIAKAQKMVGLIMEFVALTGDNNYQLLKASNANYAELKTTHATYQDAKINPGA